jgi:hypothetical protein
LRSASKDGLYCPVCGKDIAFIWIWLEQASGRIRMFCEACSHRDEYRNLPKNQRMLLSFEGFQRFAARRLLTNVSRKERAKRASEGD